MQLHEGTALLFIIIFRHDIKSTKFGNFHTTHVNVYCLNAQHSLLVAYCDVEWRFKLTKLHSFYCGQFCLCCICCNFINVEPRNV